MNSVKTQEDNINKVIQNDSLNKLCTSLIKSNTILTYGDKYDCTSILSDYDIEKYWNMDTLIRDIFMDIIEKCIKTSMSTKAIIVDVIDLKTIRQIISNTEENGLSTFMIKGDSFKTIIKLINLLTFYSISKPIGGVYSVTKILSPNTQRIINKHRLFFGKDNRDYIAEFRFRCISRDTQNDRYEVIDVTDNKIDIVTRAQLIEYTTTLHLMIFGVFVLFDGTVCIG